MNDLLFTGSLFGGSIVAGLVGALTGLGGGVVIVPLLTILFGVNIRYAIGASLISVIATSSGAASAYVRDGFSNVRIGMMLEVATSAGALAGAALAAYVPAPKLAILLGLVLVGSVFARGSHDETRPPEAAHPESLAARLRLTGAFPGPRGMTPYAPRRIPLGFGLMGIAGLLSGLLGIGSGAVKVLAMDWAMGLPFKVSTTTSNFMIGVTAAASAGVYLSRGYIDPGLTLPVTLGVLGGSLAGARVLAGSSTRVLRWLFGAVVVALAVEMIYISARGAL